MEKIQKVVVGGVIFFNKKILIIKRLSTEKIFPNIWELPSGKVEFNENPNNAILREIKEETNLDAKINIAFDVFDYLVEKKDYLRHSVQINYILTSSSDKVILNPEEHDNFIWIYENELENYNITEQTKQTILKAFKLVENKIKL